MEHKKLATVIIAVGLAVVAGIVAHHALATPGDSETWYRCAEDVELEHVGSGMAYMYWSDTSAGVVERVEPTPEELVSNIRKTDVWYRSDRTGNLCHTYIPWDDTDLELGDHMVLIAVYKYRTDLDVTDGFEPTVLVGREVTGFGITKAVED